MLCCRLIDNPMPVLGAMHISKSMQDKLMGVKVADIDARINPSQLTKELWEEVNPAPPVSDNRETFLSNLQKFAKNKYFQALFNGMDNGYVNNCPTQVYDRNGRPVRHVVRVTEFLYPESGKK